MAKQMVKKMEGCKRENKAHEECKWSVSDFFFTHFICQGSIFNY